MLELCQAVKSCSVTPDVLAEAIKDTLEKFIAAYGKEYIRPKHHYVLHLPIILAEFGVLVATFTNERKHRLIPRYLRARTHHQSFSACTLEDVTAHQLWELSLAFFNAFDTAEPRKGALIVLRDLFPGIADERFTLHSDLCINGGQCNVGDVVSFSYGGVLCYA